MDALLNSSIRCVFLAYVDACFLKTCLYALYSKYEKSTEIAAEE